ncbi:MAG: prepilin-type N-terminal cleavage/methylation domain-containing protein [Halioglobus sp.]
MKPIDMKYSRQSRGFSLLEMMVAIAILGLSLGALYQSAGGATRNVRMDERYAYGVELARSLLASNARVPAAGLSQQGETEGEFSWRVSTSPVAQRRGGNLGASLQNIEVAVSWIDGGRPREVVLHSVVEALP